MAFGRNEECRSSVKTSWPPGTFPSLRGRSGSNLRHPGGLMRGGVLLFLFALTGCYDPGAERVGDVELPVNTSGRTLGDDACVGGELVILFDQPRGDELSGTAYYESDDMEGERYRSTSRVEGWLRDDAIVLDEVETIEADALPPSFRWCFGRYSLAREGQGEAMSLAGLFESNDCGCRGETRLGNPQVPKRASPATRQSSPHSAPGS